MSVSIPLAASIFMVWLGAAVYLSRRHRPQGDLFGTALSVAVMIGTGLVCWNVDDLGRSHLLLRLGDEPLGQVDAVTALHLTLVDLLFLWIWCRGVPRAQAASTLFLQGLMHVTLIAREPVLFVQCFVLVLLCDSLGKPHIRTAMERVFIGRRILGATLLVIAFALPPQLPAHRGCTLILGVCLTCIPYRPTAPLQHGPHLLSLAIAVLGIDTLSRWIGPLGPDAARWFELPAALGFAIFGVVCLLRLRSTAGPKVVSAIVAATITVILITTPDPLDSLSALGWSVAVLALAAVSVGADAPLRPRIRWALVAVTLVALVLQDRPAIDHALDRRLENLAVGVEP